MLLFLEVAACLGRADRQIRKARQECRLKNAKTRLAPGFRLNLEVAPYAAWRLVAADLRSIPDPSVK